MFRLFSKELAEMKNEKEIIEQRKDDHLEICCNNKYDIEMSKTNGFEDIQFVPRAVPEINFEDINLECDFLEHHFQFPIFLSSMTGGVREGKKMNEKIAKVAEELQIGMGVGSQRAAILDPTLRDTFSIVRDVAPTAFIAANIGAVQLNYNFSFRQVLKAIEMIKADALILHFNALQEIVQPEGDKNFANLLGKISKLNKELDCPIIAKEVGCGMSFEDGSALVDAGVKVIDVAGAGGTSWSKIEAIRAKQQLAISNQEIGELFGDWGLSTAVSTLEISELSDKVGIISSGGIRNGLEAAKALALNANLVGTALPIARILKDGTETQLLESINRLIQEIKTAMFLVGAKNLEELRSVPLVIVGKTSQWLSARGFEY